MLLTIQTDVWYLTILQDHAKISTESPNGSQEHWWNKNQNGRYWGIVGDPSEYNMVLSSLDTLIRYCRTAEKVIGTYWTVVRSCIWEIVVSSKNNTATYWWVQWGSIERSALGNPEYFEGSIGNCYRDCYGIFPQTQFSAIPCKSNELIEIN